MQALQLRMRVVETRDVKRNVMKNGTYAAVTGCNKRVQQTCSVGFTQPRKGPKYMHD